MNLRSNDWSGVKPPSKACSSVLDKGNKSIQCYLVCIPFAARERVTDCKVYLATTLYSQTGHKA